MNRRHFFSTLAAAPAVMASGVRGEAASAQTPAQSKFPARSLPRGKITRVRIYEPPTPNRLFNQSNLICTVETDFGVTGIGEGGSKDTLEQCAGTLIGKDPFKIEAIWRSTTCPSVSSSRTARRSPINAPAWASRWT